MKKVTKRLLSLLFAAVLLVTVMPMGLLASAEEVPASKWMSLVPADAKIVNMNIPGTHDSAMFGSQWGVGAFAETQNLSIREQLAAGVRIFDLRLRYGGKGELYLCHGQGKLCCDAYDGQAGMLSGKLTYAKVFEYVKTFLETNPSETVIFFVQHEHEAKDEVDDFGTYDGTREDLENKYDDLIIRLPRKRTDLTMGAARGHIVMFPYGGGFGQLMEDKYNDYEVTAADKWKVVEPYLEESKDQDAWGSNDLPRAIYTSCTGQYTYDENGKKVPNNIHYEDNVAPTAKKEANRINPLIKNFNFVKGKYYGWIAMDCADEELCKLVYGTNSFSNATYISDIRGFCGDKKGGDGKDLINTVAACEKAGYSVLSSEDITNVNPDGYTMVIGYRRTTDVTDAIREIVGYYGFNTSVPKGFTKVKISGSSFNYFTRGSGDQSSDTYLAYKKTGNENPVTSIFIVSDEGNVKVSGTEVAFNLNDGLNRMIGINVVRENDYEHSTVAVAKTYYISDIRGFCGDEKGNNAEDLAKTIKRCQDAGYRVLSTDGITNVNVDGYSMVIGYKITDNAYDAITKLVGSYDDSTPSGFTKVKTENSLYNYFTRGSGSKSEDTYLFYSKARDAKPITSISILAQTGNVKQQNGDDFNLNEGLGRTVGLQIERDDDFSGTVLSAGGSIIIIAIILALAALAVAFIIISKRKKRVLTPEEEKAKRYSH